MRVADAVAQKITSIDLTVKDIIHNSLSSANFYVSKRSY
jgi:hypothetical protein